MEKKYLSFEEKMKEKEQKRKKELEGQLKEYKDMYEE